MTYLVQRFSSQSNDTLGLFFRRGDVTDQFMCFTLEDEHRATKVRGETRIPAGIYPLRLRTHGGFHERYSNKFDFHQGMIEVCNVPGFTDILIHVGNDEGDTAGCLLVGDSATQNATRDGFIGNSTNAYQRVYKAILADLAKGPCYIEYRDHI